MSGEDPDIQVPFREIQLSPTVTEEGTTVNKPVLVYDTAGPYHDTSYTVDVQKGIPKLRTPWIEDRNDTLEYEGRKIVSLDNGFKSNNHKNLSRHHLNINRKRQKQDKMLHKCIMRNKVLSRRK